MNRLIKVIPGVKYLKYSYNNHKNKITSKIAKVTTIVRIIELVLRVGSKAHLLRLIDVPVKFPFKERKDRTAKNNPKFRYPGHQYSNNVEICQSLLSFKTKGRKGIRSSSDLYKYVLCEGM